MAARWQSQQDRGTAMSEHNKNSDGSDTAHEPSHRLLLKAAVAVAGVVALVVALVMVESPREPEPPPTARTVTPTGVVQPAPGPEGQSGSLAEAAMQALRNSSEAAELQSIVMAEQLATASAALNAPVVREESADPLGVPANAPVKVPALASAPQAASARRNESSGRLVLEQSPPKGARASSSISSVAALVKAPATPAKPLAPAAATTAARGDFFVQVGVFANPGNAEELRAKLKAAGIPTLVETRVQIGPFASRQDATVAQAKLKALGLDGGMVVPARH